MSYLTRLSQNVTADATNSSTSNLAANAIFIGTATSLSGVHGIMVQFHADQNCHIFVDQAPDTALHTGGGTVAANNTTTMTGTGTNFMSCLHVGDTIVFDSGGTPQTRVVASITSDTVADVTVAFTGGALSGKAWQQYAWDASDEYNYFHMEDDFGVVVTAISAYVRLRVINVGTATTQVLRLNTFLVPIAESLPRSLDANGFLQAAVTDMYDHETSNHFKIDQFRSLKTAEQTKLIGTKFSGGTKDTNFWTETVANGGTVAQGSGAVTLSTNTTANGSAAYASVRSSRFIANVANNFRAVAKFGDTGTTNNVRQFGNFDANNGAFFQLSGTTFSLVVRSGGSDTVIPQSAWNGKHSAFVVDTNYHGFDIEMGFDAAYFFIDGVFAHEATQSGLSTPLYQNLDLPINITNTNSGGSTTNCTLSLILATVSRFGKLTTESIYKNIAAATTTVCKYTPGRLNRIIFNSDATQTVTVYDNTSATTPIIATLTNVLPGGSGHNIPNSVAFDCPFSTGLTIVTSTAAPITVVYE